MNDFHFLRPEYFFLLIPLFLFTIYLFKKTKTKRGWEEICSADLIPYLVSFQTKGNSILFCVIPISFVLLVVGLAGPTWEKVELPVVKSKSGLVIALDLSPEMNADDIKPTRLQRAIYKINDLLALRKEGQTALIVFSDESFVVTPLTEDVATIQSLTAVLETKIMPIGGHSVLKTLKKAEQLFTEAQINQRSILLITSRISDQDLKESISYANSHRLTLSVLGIGKEGATTISDGKGGLIKNQDGSLLVTTLAKGHLKKLAADTGGIYKSISIHDEDVLALSHLFKTSNESESIEEKHRVHEKWDDKGYLMALLALPFVLFLFRKEFLFGFLLFFPLMGNALDWETFWKTKDQQGEDLFNQENYEKASEVFENCNWKGAALYRAGKFSESALEFEKDNTSQSLYNLGTAKAKAQDYQGAIDAYNRVLNLDPNHEDAKFNKALLENFLKQNQSDKKNEPDQSTENSNEQNEQQDQKDGQEQTDKNQDAKSSQDQEGEENKNKMDEQEQQKSQSGEEKQDSSEEFKNKMDREIEEARQEDNKAEKQPCQQSENSISPEEEQQQLDERWLNKIKDEPGDLLRRKFLQQYKQQSQSKR